MTGSLVSERTPGGAEAPFVARIAGVGRELPATRVTTRELMATTRHRTGIDLERLTGIRERRVADDDQPSLSLAVGAARDCLERSPNGAEDLDVVLSCSISKYRRRDRAEDHRWPNVHQYEPALSLAVAQAIGATRATTFDVANACAGMLTGVFVLNNWVRRGAIRSGLVVSGERLAPLRQNAARHVRSILSRELASLTLGDAGAAVLLERADEGTPGITMAGFTTVADHSRLCLAGPARHDPGARMFTKARALQRVAIADTSFLLGEALANSGRTLDDIDHVIPHQTSVRAIRKAAKEMRGVLPGEPTNPTVVTVDRYGNTASTTHFVALADELRAGRVHPGDRIALVALASGLEVGVVIFVADEELVRRYGNPD